MSRINQAAFNRKGATAIPTDYVLTPGGFRHRSLTHFVPKGNRVERQSKRLRQVRMDTGEQLDFYPLVPKTAPIPDLGSGWVVYTSWSNNTGSPISRFVTQWTVPPAPANIDSQTIFLFNSIEDLAQDDIVQPVLQWGVSAAGGGNYWAIANWYVDNTGHASYSSLTQVNPGDLLTGLITLVEQNGSNFNYQSSFQNHPEVDLAIGAISELLWATETLEAYQISQCSDYPTAKTSMFSIELAVAKGTNPALSWEVSTPITDCNQSAVVINGANPGGEVDIVY